VNWEAIGAVGEVVGAIAVVVTLVYLTIQLKQNTQSAQNSAWQSIIRVLTDLDVTEATDPQLSAFIRLAESSPDELPEDQYWKFTKIAEARLGTFEYAYLATNKGTIDSYYWEAIRPYAENYMRKPGYRRFWAEASEAVYHPEFITYINSVIAKHDVAV
jgi:hypothetical protein